MFFNRNMDSKPRFDNFPPLSTPLLMICTSTPLTPKLSSMERQARRSGNVRHCEAISGHYLPEEAPEQTLQALLQIQG